MEEAIWNTFLCAMVVVFTVVSNVAANTWLSVWPLMADTNSMPLFQCFWEHFGMNLGTRHKMT